MSEKEGGIPRKLGENIETHSLRLVCLTSHSCEGRHLNMRCGRDAEERQALLEETERELKEIWTDLNLTALIEMKDATKFDHCEK